MAAGEKKRIVPFIVGLVVVLLALVGAGNLIQLATGSVQNLFGDASKRAEYEEFLACVVRNDPDTFDDVAQADPTQLLDAAIWRLLQSNLQTDTYPTVEIDGGAGLEIPQGDVEKNFGILFGTDAVPVHSTLDNGSYVFTYNKTKQVYIVPITAIEPLYIPRVTAIDQKSKSIVLTVAYLPANGFSQDENLNIVAPEPDKIRKITLRSPKDAYFVGSIEVA
ncbi:MAG: hypothetical protein LBN05_04360 [Oscillospiraceae bacterium]|jgi:hypothetical protein|nr:hypothetical protein [Oscillospiraceae bacterium]